MKKLFYLGLVFVLTFILILLVTEYRVRGETYSEPTLTKFDSQVVVQQNDVSYEVQQYLTTGVVVVWDWNYPYPPIEINLSQSVCNYEYCLWTGYWTPANGHTYMIDLICLYDTRDGTCLEVYNFEDGPYSFYSMFLPLVIE
jgi:hypothetical protein